jgi:arabinofuranosyltransferase
VREHRKSEILLLVFFILFYAIILFKTAWVSDDAFITFRTVDNFINGYGPTYNVSHRVQAYTHPLWMLLQSFYYLFTHEIFYSSMFISIVISLIAVVLFSVKIAKSTLLALLGILILSLSKAFVDYSTSGLENPLAHFTLAIFFIIYIGSKESSKKVFLLSLSVSLVSLVRLDLILICLPALIYTFFFEKSPKLLSRMVLGFSPLIVWEIFSIIYYGFPFPNTAYAKLNTGINQAELSQQGFLYLLNSIKTDHVTLIVILTGIAIPIITKTIRQIPLALGIILYLVYIIKVGGDFMGGRFFAPLLFCAVAMISQLELNSFRVLFPAYLLIIAIGLTSPYPTVLCDSGYSNRKIDKNGIADERGYYYQNTGLLKTGRYTELPRHIWKDQGIRARETKKKLVMSNTIGMLGFYAGPTVHILDEFALADPLLARLPAVKDPNWRIGHFARHIPEGYVATLRSGRNVIKDRKLALFYNKISIITRDKLFSWSRILTIFSTNLGRYNHLIDFKAYRYPTMIHRNLEDLEFSEKKAASKGKERYLVITDCGIQINLGKITHSEVIEISLDSDDDYLVVYSKNKTEIANQKIKAALIPKSGLHCYAIKVPDKAVKKGYNELIILPARGDGKYAVGKARLF